MIELTVNGEARSLEQPTSILCFLAAHDLQRGMVVVERNGEIVPRDQFEDVLAQHGDVLEIVQMMAGG